jgi:IS30 family transposase
MKKSFKHLRREYRDRIEALLDAGIKQKEIAKILKVNKSTVSRELKRRRDNGQYDSDTAERKAAVLRSNSKHQGMKIESCPEEKLKIIIGLKAWKSPDEIAHESNDWTTSFSTPTIYKWLYSCFGQQYCRHLCTKRFRRRKQKQNKTTRVMIPNKISIHDKPKGENLVEIEGDTFLSPKKLHTTVCGFVSSVVGTHLIIGTKMPNLKTKTMVEAVNRSTKEIGPDQAILDNGIENRSHEAFDMPAFFCDPHAPWQKPHVEGDIGLLRRWFIPKGTDLRKIKEEELQKYFNILNHKKRRIYGYRSAYEVSLERGIIQKIPPRILSEKLHFRV